MILLSYGGANQLSKYLISPRLNENDRIERPAQEVLPFNIVADDELRSFLLHMIRRSPTFKHQCEQIGRARLLRVRVVVSSPRPVCGCRASSLIRKYETGLIIATVHLYPPRVLDAELIAHEFEHALEQTEGLDLDTLSSVKNSRVYERPDGSFETERARRAGLTVEAEFWSSRARR